VFTKEEVVVRLKLAFEKAGQITYHEACEHGGLNQNHIEVYFGTLKKACDVLGLSSQKKKMKVVFCAKCNKEMEISKYSLDDFDRYCRECLIEIHNSKFDGLVEGEDYLKCPECGFRNKSLEGHFRKNAKTWRACRLTKEEVEEKYGKIRIFAPVVDKNSKKNRRKNGWFKDKEATLKRMSESGGKHCLGKTKENCENTKTIK